MSITAMKQALEALEMLAKWEHPASNITTKTGRIYPQRIAADAADVLRVAMAEADRKKPVAWATDLHFDADTEIIPAKQKGRLGTDGMPVPLFSGPFAAQRQWVGLTDAEIAEWDYDVRDVVMDIEKLLREKNT